MSLICIVDGISWIWLRSIVFENTETPQEPLHDGGPRSFLCVAWTPTLFLWPDPKPHENASIYVFRLQKIVPSSCFPPLLLMSWNILDHRIYRVRLWSENPGRVWSTLVICKPRRTHPQLEAQHQDADSTYTKKLFYFMKNSSKTSAGCLIQIGSATICTFSWVIKSHRQIDMLPWETTCGAGIQ